MATTYYKLLSQDQPEIERGDGVGVSLSATSDEATSSDDDSLDLALLKLGNRRPKRKVRRKLRNRRTMGNLSNFDGGDSYEVS